jgi:hypothetical protein
MHSIFQDVRFGLRMLAKNPGITLVAILTLGLGIGANTATFSLSNTFLRKPVSFPEVERLVMVLNRAPGQQGQDWSAASPADFLTGKGSPLFVGLAGYEWADVNLECWRVVRAQGFRVRRFLRRARVRRVGPGFRCRRSILAKTQSDSQLRLWAQQFASDPGVGKR